MGRALERSLGTRAKYVEIAFLSLCTIFSYNYSKWEVVDK